MVLFLSLQNRMVLSLLHQSCLILALFLSPQNLVVLFSFTSEPHGSLSIYLLQNLVVLPFTSEPRDLLLSPPKPCGPLFPFIRTAWTSVYLLQNHMALFLSLRTTWSSLFPIHFIRTVWTSTYLLASEPRGSLSLWLPCLGLNPSAHLPLQPHFRLLLQSVTPASIPVFFQIYWGAIVSLGRCGPMAWSQSSPSSHTGSVTRGSCLLTSWVEVTSIPPGSKHGHSYLT